MRTRSTSRLPALVLALVAGGAARDAAACLDLGDACGDVDTWNSALPMFDADIPTDGMLLVRFLGPSDVPPMVEFITLEVTLDGAPVAGALEEIGVDGLLGWRPAAPLAPTSQYVVAGTIHNVDFQPGLEFCGEEFVPFEFEFGTAAGPMPPLAAPEVFAETAVGVAEKLTLEDIVCCDGAYPYWFGGCGGGGSVDYNEGFCARLQYTGRLDVRVIGTLGDLGPTAPMLAAELVVDGVPEAGQLVVGAEFQLRASASQPVCTEVVLRNVVTAEVVSTPAQCHGQDLAGQLGPQTLTPDSPLLTTECAGQPYVCEIDEAGDSWDPDRCVPWPEGQASTGEPATGGPTSGGSGGTGGTSGTGGSGTTPGGTGGTGSISSPIDDGLVEHGCACDGARPDALAWLLALALPAVRRRSRRA